MNLRVRMRAFAFEPRTPPTEIQLWNAGDNATDYGVHKWTDRSAKEVVGRYEERGNPLLIDVEHNGAKSEETGEPEATGGYARLELREGAPWLSFDWSSYGVEQIASGQRRFLSPEYDVDKDTGEILALYRVSLVADPGTHRARMLAAASPPQETRMDFELFLAALRAALAAEDPAVAKESALTLVAEVAKAAGGEGGAPPPTEGGDPPPPATAGADGPPADDKADKADPQAAAAGDKDDDATKAAADDDAKTKAAAKPAPIAAAAKPAPAPGTSTKVDTVAAAAIRAVEDTHRDMLLAAKGDRLEPSIRRWASSQPLAIVKGLLESAPDKTPASGTRIAATRGEGQGSGQPRGLQGKELEDFNRSMGIVPIKTGALEPHDADGRFVLPSTPPSALRAHRVKAEAAAAAGKAGK